ncbi:uncharacterized protein [Parasteatoda tepidariorum]|uniref:uncharacterized protein n=1 Tax=Parasteatoda tepidariorum TaxID=114398 RepID=UPI00077F8805|nr:extensin-like [Parasteatoda tepidariorum]
MSLGLILPLALLVVVRAQMPHMPPMPMPMQPPPPYNMYGPVNPYAGGSATSVMYPSAPQQMPPPPMSPPLPYPPGTTMSYSSSAYPIMSAAAPYPTYGVPPPLMYPPPYQTYSGSGPTGDPFTSSSGNGIFNAKTLSQLLGLRKRR